MLRSVVLIMSLLGVHTPALTPAAPTPMPSLAQVQTAQPPQHHAESTLKPPSTPLPSQTARPAPVVKPAPPPPPPPQPNQLFYDAANPADIPASANNPSTGVAGYTNGWGGYSQMVQQFPQAFHILINAGGTTPQDAASDGNDAAALDIEPGAAPMDPGSIHAWNAERNAEGMYAVDYTYIDNVPSVEQAAQGTQYHLWIANLTGDAQSAIAGQPEAQAVQDGYGGPSFAQSTYDVDSTNHMTLQSLFGPLPRS